MGKNEKYTNESGIMAETIEELEKKFNEKLEKMDKSSLHTIAEQMFDWLDFEDRKEFVARAENLLDIQEKMKRILEKKVI